jgi:tRNA(Arg) A34 adenosine deaminase TadA
MTTYHYNEYLQDQMPELWIYAKAHSHDPIRPVAAFLENAEGKVIARGTNILANGQNIDNWKDRSLVRSVITHAEVDCFLRAAINKSLNARNNNCTLYITLEPCSDCRAVIESLGIGSVVYGEPYVPSDAKERDAGA